MKEVMYFREWVAPTGVYEPDIFVFNHENKSLGVISWFEKWKCFVWKQDSEIVMSAGCLEKVIEFMRGLESKRKELKTK